MHQEFLSEVVSSTDMEEVLPASDKRISLILQNQHATANIFISNNPCTKGAARLRLPPGGDLLLDYKVPTDAIYAQADAAGVELTVIAGS